MISRAPGSASSVIAVGATVRFSITRAAVTVKDVALKFLPALCADVTRNERKGNVWQTEAD